MKSKTLTDENEHRERLTEAELARLFGVGRSSIHSLVERGLLTKGPDGLIDLEQAKREIAENMKSPASKLLAAVHEMSAEQPTDQPDDTQEEPNALHQARRRREEAEAGLREIKLKQAQKEVIDRAGYERAAMSTARLLRDSLVDTLPAKIAAELAALAVPWEVECRLREQLRAELREICMILDNQ